MSKYTIELRKVCDIYTREEVESWFKDYDISDYLTPDEIKVITDRNTWNKDKLAKKIVDYYFMREIGQETPALFKHYAKIKMDLIMESKLPLIYSASIKYDPLVNVDYTETYKKENSDSGNSNSTSNNNASGLTVNSDTPQGQINKNAILNGDYASSTQAGESTNQMIDTTNTNSKGQEDSIKTVKGNAGISATAQAMVKQYRENIRAIDYEIIKELSSLFMMLY